MCINDIAYVLDEVARLYIQHFRNITIFKYHKSAAFRACNTPISSVEEKKHSYKNVRFCKKKTEMINFPQNCKDFPPKS